MRILSVMLSPAILLALGVAALCVVLQLAGFANILRYDRTAIQAGHWWLLLSGNFVHLGIGHLLLNLSGFGLIVALVWANFNLLEWLLLILVCSWGVGVGLYWFDQDILWYVGFSGTLHGLIMAGSLADLRRYPAQSAGLMLLILLKLGWEQRYGAMPGSEAAAGGRVVVNSHLYGTIVGALVGAVLIAAQRWQRRESAHTPP